MGDTFRDQWKNHQKSNKFMPEWYEWDYQEIDAYSSGSGYSWRIKAWNNRSRSFICLTVQKDDWIIKRIWNKLK